MANDLSSAFHLEIGRGTENPGVNIKGTLRVGVRVQIFNPLVTLTLKEGIEGYRWILGGRGSSM
jgi:hypothetical protein